VAADLPQIDHELADRLAGLEQIENAVARGDAATSAAGLTSPPLPGTLRDCDQLRARTDRALERGEVVCPDASLSTTSISIPARPSFVKMRGSSTGTRPAR
jgi:hypothetical protein